MQNLYENILNQPELQNIPMDTINVITRLFANSMDEEKQQIIDAHASGFCDNITPEYYYEKNYLTNYEGK